MFPRIQFVIIFLMKKIITIICIISACIAIGLSIFLFQPNTTKHSNSEILATFSETQFYSNYKTLPEKSLNTYTLTFSTLNGKSLENPKLDTSINIHKTIDFEISSITVTFQILFGSEFSFALTTSNFEDLTITKQATEFVQPDNISLGIATSPSGNELGFVDENTNILYLVNEQYKQLAQEDGNPSALYVKAYAPTSTAFDFEISESCHFNIDKSDEYLILTGQTIGASYLTISAKDGSGASKKFLFRVQYVKATNVSGLPSQINIDLSNDIYFNLPQILPEPIYAKGHTISLQSSNTTLFTVSNNKITALKSGTGNLIVLIDGEEVLNVPVNIIGSITPQITFTINDLTKQELSKNINFDSNTNTITLNYTNLQDGYSTITINVSFLHYNGQLLPIDTNHIDPSLAVLKDSTSPGFGVGNANYVPYTINVLHKNAEIEIEFSKTIE